MHTPGSGIFAIAYTSDFYLILNLPYCLLSSKKEVLKENIHFHYMSKIVKPYHNERKSEQTHIPYAPTFLENGVNNAWKFQTLVTGDQTENQFHPSCTK